MKITREQLMDIIEILDPDQIEEICNEHYTDEELYAGVMEELEARK